MKELFKTFSVDAAEARRIEATPSQPHLHDFEELLIGIEGSVEHFIDFKSEVLHAPFIYFVTKGKVHRVITRPTDENYNLTVFRFQSEFIPETTFQLYSYYHDYANIRMKPNNGFKKIEQLSNIILDEMREEKPDLTIVRNLLTTLFVMIESERRKISTNESESNKQNSITFKNFLAILEANFRRNEGVEFYAEKLFMTSRNLNLICQNILHQSVSEIIETRKLIEAKNLLISSDKSISEIGYELGYNEKSYFSNVFKKRTGQSPGEFKDAMRKILVS